MIRDNLFNRLWVRLVIILLQIPLYFIWLYTAISLLQDESLIHQVLPNSAISCLIPPLFHVWIVCELIFSIHYALAKRRLERYNQEIPEMSPEDRWGLVNSCLETVEDPVQWVTGWFREKGSLRQPNIDAVRQGNVREW